MKNVTEKGLCLKLKRQLVGAVTQIILWTLNGGRSDGVKHESETGGNTGIPVPVSKGSEKRKIVFAG
jgi:hypothetical protein